MKLKIKTALSALREGAATVLRRHPLELLLLAVLTGALILCYEREWEPDRRLMLAGWGAALLLIVNLLAGPTAWRRLYWVAWAPLVPLAFWSGFPDWAASAQGLISVAILTPLALLACRRAVDNRRFVNDTLVYLRSGVLAMLFAWIACGLFEAILWSAAYIFTFDNARWVVHLSMDALFVTQFFAAPTLFLMMLDRWERAEVSGSRILEVLLNCIVSPAVVVYAAMLYLYMAKIVVIWSLPEGGVAYLVFGFTMVALAVKALQMLLSKPLYEWFYGRLSWVSLPFIVLFWVGVIRRVSEYGLTEPRSYLLACGLVMTFCVVLFLERRVGRYLWVVLFALVVFAAIAYVPALEPRRMALRSQEARFERIARQLDRLSDDGRFVFAPVPLSDTVRREAYRQLYTAFEYVLEHGGAQSVERWGWPKNTDRLSGFEGAELLDCLPDDRFRDYVRWGSWRMPDTQSDDPDSFTLYAEDTPFPADSRYTRIYDVSGYSVLSDGDSLLFWTQGSGRWRISGSDLAQALLAGADWRPAADEPMVPADSARWRALLDWRTDSCRIGFRRITFTRRDSLLWVTDADVAVFMRR